MKLERILLSGAAVIAMGGQWATGVATAQTEPSEVAAPAADASEPVDAEAKLGKVVVTARRREEDLQSVPLSVTAFSPDDLVLSGIDDRTSLADNTPSLITITGGYPSEFAFFALRGQGPAFGSVPGVISYFAEVPNTINVDGRVGSYYDLSNIQVLAGPQGTLFGKNATGGNILFEPQRPTDEFEGYVSAQVGNFNDRRVEGAVNLPINEKALLRVAGEIGRRDGFTKDVGPLFNGKDYDNLSYESARVSLLLQPTDRLELYTIGRYYNSENNGGSTVPFAFNPSAGALGALVTDFFPGIVGAVNDQAALGPRRVAYDLDQFAETEYWQFINQATYDLTDDLKLKNIFSYSDFSNIYGYDYDATLFPVAGQGVRGDVPTNDVKTYTEELQLQGTLFNDTVDFAAGVYADRQVTAQAGQFLQFPFSILLGGTFFAAFDTTAESQAVFGQATVEMGRLSGIDGLSFTGGYRYTWEQVESSTVIIAPPASVGTGEFEYGSYNLTLDYDLTQDVHAYITHRTAYKAGGINGSVPEGLPFHTYPPEKLSDIEIGLKSEFLIGGMQGRANIAAYTGDYTNIQRFTSEVINGAVLNVTRSAAEGKIEGVELTASILPFEGLTLDGSYSATNSSYTKVNDASAGAILDGSPFPFTPDWKYSIGASYRTNLPAVGSVIFNANYVEQSAFSTGQTNASFVREIPGYGLLNYSVDLIDVAGSGLDLSLFATNATDNQYATGTFDAYNAAFGIATYVYGEPRMYGLRARYDF